VAVGVRQAREVEDVRVVDRVVRVDGRIGREPVRPLARDRRERRLRREAVRDPQRVVDGMPWSRARWTSTAPRSWTTEKQPGRTAGVPQAAGSAVPGLGTWKRMLRSESSICSSLRYWPSSAKPDSSGPSPTAGTRRGLSNATPSGIVRFTAPALRSTSMPCARNSRSSAAVRRRRRRRPQHADGHDRRDHAWAMGPPRSGCCAARGPLFRAPTPPLASEQPVALSLAITPVEGDGFGQLRLNDLPANV
jgi:hypothetical protein